jgi:hypothetical protein
MFPSRNVMSDTIMNMGIKIKNRFPIYLNIFLSSYNKEIKKALSKRGPSGQNHSFNTAIIYHPPPLTNSPAVL